MKLEEVILRDDRASQPAANTVPIGTLYFVTDEEVTERSDGTNWQSYSGAGGAAPDTETYLTVADETGVLPNSRQLLAGTNITFDDSTPGERTVNASGGGGGVILEEEITLTNAQILALNSSPISFLPAPSTGFAYIPVGWMISTKFFPTGYSAFEIRIGGAYDALVSPSFTDQENIYFEWITTYNESAGNLVDQALFIYAAADPTGGDPANTAYIKFLYMLVDINP